MIEQRLYSIFANAVGSEIDPKSISDGTPLSTLGIDSLNVVELLLELERSFSITIEEEELTQAVFETFGTLKQFVSAKAGQPAHS